MFIKLFYCSIAENIKQLIDRGDDAYCFRYHRERVYYVSETIMRKSLSVSRKNLVSLGVCFGRFTRSKKFILHITALEYLAPYAKVSYLEEVTTVHSVEGVYIRV